MCPFPGKNNTILLSSEPLDGKVLLRHLHCPPGCPRNVLAPGAWGVHLFPHRHSLHSSPNFGAVLHPACQRGSAANLRTIFPHSQTYSFRNGGVHKSADGSCTPPDCEQMIGKHQSIAKACSASSATLLAGTRPPPSDQGLAEGLFCQHSPVCV
jgi:hypothetical protein